MEPSQFDKLTKVLATATSRRQALKTIAATTLAGLLGLGGIGTAFAKCKPEGHPCSKDKHCCSGFCNQPTHTCGCPSGLTCGDGCCPAEMPVCCILTVGGTQCCPPPSSGCGCFGDIGDCLC